MLTTLIQNGILPTRGSFTLDLVVIAMAAVIPVLAISIFLSKHLKKYRWHRTIQLVLTLLLLVAIVMFEVDMRLFTDWRALAEPSPFYESGWVDISLAIHLCFAIPTPFVWGFVVYQAMKKIDFDSHAYRERHRRWGWIASGLMLGTAVTGWCFYWLAFVS